MAKDSYADCAPTPRSSGEAVRRLMLDQRRLAAILCTQMWQAHWSVRGEGRIVADGVFAQIAERIGELVGLLSAHIARRGLLQTQAAGASDEPPLLRFYPLGVADERAHAFAASGALAVVAQTARDDARTARALDDPACERLFAHIAACVDAQIWRVQRSLDLPVVTAIVAMYSGPRPRRPSIMPQSAAERRQRARPGDVRMKPRRVLIVEDDAMTRLLLADVLAEAGHVVCAVAATESEAVAAERRARPDLVIIDANLGRGSGAAAMRQILRSGFVAHVYISGESLSVAPLHPAAATLRKPFDADALNRAIAHAVGA